MKQSEKAFCVYWRITSNSDSFHNPLASINPNVTEYNSPKGIKDFLNVSHGNLKCRKYITQVTYNPCRNSPEPMVSRKDKQVVIAIICARCRNNKDSQWLQRFSLCLKMIKGVLSFLMNKWINVSPNCQDISSHKTCISVSEIHSIILKTYFHEVKNEQCVELNVSFRWHWWFLVYLVASHEKPK